MQHDMHVKDSAQSFHRFYVSAAMRRLYVHLLNKGVAGHRMTPRDAMTHLCRLCHSPQHGALIMAIFAEAGLSVREILDSHNLDFMLSSFSCDDDVSCAHNCHLAFVPDVAAIACLSMQDSHNKLLLRWQQAISKCWHLDIFLVANPTL